METIFTQIVNGSIPAHRVYESKHVLGFLDIHPIAPGHTLIVSKRQVDQFTDLSEAEFKDLMGSVHEFSKHLKQTLGCKRIVVRIEGFDVPHVHVHLVPVNHEGESYKADRDKVEPNHPELMKIAQKIKLSN